MSLPARRGRDAADRRDELGRGQLTLRVARRLGVALVLAGCLPLDPIGAARPAPWSWCLRALRGDLGVSATSGIDVDARVRVFAVGTLALLGLALAVMAACTHVLPATGGWARRGRGSITAVVVVVVLAGALDRSSNADPAGAHLGAAVIDRLLVLVAPAMALGIALALVARRRLGPIPFAVGARDAWPLAVLGVLVAEVAFGRPGVGMLAADAIAAGDGPLLRGVVLVVATLLAIVPPAAAPPGSPKSPESPGSLVRPLTPDRTVVAAAVVAVTAVTLLVFADRLGLDAPGAPATDPWWADHLGRDALARALSAGRTSLAVASAAAGLGIAGGWALGAVGGSLPVPSARLRRGRVGETAILVVAALLAGVVREPRVVVVLAAILVVVPVAPLAARAVDAAWRARGVAPLLDAMRTTGVVAVSAIGLLVVADAVWGLLGLAPDGRATLGRELAEQLPHAATAPAGVLAPLAVVAVLGWSVAALGYGVVAGPAAPSSEVIAAQSSADGRPQPSS